MKKKIDEYKQALDRKSQYATSAAGVRANIKQRFQNVDQDIVNTEQEVQKLSGEVQQFETNAGMASGIQMDWGTVLESSNRGEELLHT